MTSTSAVTPRLSTGTVTIPSGTIAAGPNDLFVVHTDGDLWLHPGILAGDTSASLRLADLTDPRLPAGPEGDGPNAVEDVAGEVDGVVYYSDCCSPIVGDLLAATGADSERIILGAGYAPALSPDRTRLATANGIELVVIDLTAGTYQARNLNDEQMWIEPWDVIWTPDATSVVVLYFETSSQWSLVRFAAAPPFEHSAPVPLGVAFEPMSTDVVRFAGRGPDGEIAITIGTDRATVIRYFDPVTLVEIPAMQRSLPTGARSVQLAADGVSVLWIDDTSTLWYIPAGGDAHQFGDGYTAAWFNT